MWIYCHQSWKAIECNTKTHWNSRWKLHKIKRDRRLKSTASSNEIIKSKSLRFNKRTKKQWTAQKQKSNQQIIIMFGCLCTCEMRCCWCSQRCDAFIWVAWYPVSVSAYKLLSIVVKRAHNTCKIAIHICEMRQTAHNSYYMENFGANKSTNFAFSNGI